MQNPIKLHFVENFSEGDADLQLMAMKKVFDFTDSYQAKVIFCGSITKMYEARGAKSGGQILATYCWDYYKWAHEGKHDGFNWKEYARFLKACDLIFVPSKAQQLRLKELLDLDSVVIHTGIRLFEGEPEDKRFILDPLRYYHNDPAWDWAEKAAKELNIPIIHSEHQYTQDQFIDLLRTCTFTTSCVEEASTGALSLMEALWFGKPALVSDSPYQGAADYVGPYGTYFQHKSFEDLKRQMKWMWEHPPKFNRSAAKQYIIDHFNYDQMAQGMYESLHSIIQTHRR